MYRYQCTEVISSMLHLKTADSGSHSCILRNFATYITEEPDAMTLVLLSSSVHKVFMFCEQDKAPNIICFPRAFILQSSA